MSRRELRMSPSTVAVIGRGRRAACLAMAWALLGLTMPAEGQLTAKVYRVGWLGPGSAPPPVEQTAGEFQQALRDLGYVEGRNVVIDYRYAGGSIERLPQLAGELVSLKADVIVTAGEPAALAAKRATNAIPVVATEIGMDPVKAGIVTSLARPEANVTGLATQNEELWQKRLSVFKQLVPKIARAAVLWNPANPGNRACVEEINAAAPALGIQVVPQQIVDANALERAFAAIARDRLDALMACWDSVTLTHARRIAEFALKQRMPTLAPIKEFVEAGSLMSLGVSLPAHQRRAAYYVDRVLKGSKPGALPPVERPLQFDLVLNLGTAKELSITVPPGILVLADDLIK
jgi:putative ABC transport system substrate-binding protein